MLPIMIRLVITNNTTHTHTHTHTHTQTHVHTQSVDGIHEYDVLEEIHGTKLPESSEETEVSEWILPIINSPVISNINLLSVCS